MIRFFLYNGVILLLHFNFAAADTYYGGGTAQSCPPNEVFNSCVQAICAPLNCSQINQPIACALLVNGSCQSDCVCAPGFLRDENGVCVPESSCPESTSITCGNDEQLDTCPGNCNDFCPTNEDDNLCLITAPDPEYCGTPVCRCGFNSKRSNDNGTCIPTRDCPPFACSRPNEEYDPCPPFCSDNCSAVTPTGECNIIGFIGIVVECNPTCRCITGFGRDASEFCVPLDQCPDDTSVITPQCSINEEFSSCIQKLCRGVNCSQLGQQIDCPLDVEDGSCQSGCVCVAGNLKDGNGNCVPEDQCSNNSPQCEGVNEEFNPCGNACDNDACPGIIDEEKNCFAPAVCAEVCQCISNFKRDANGNCIPIDQCPVSVCGPNEVFNSCANVCDNDACPGISDFANPDDCVGIALCLEECQCLPDFKRGPSGVCVPQDQCPEQQCGPNEFLNFCANGCDNDSCPAIVGELNPANCIAPAVCLVECQCMENFKRDQNGICIPQEQCSGLEQQCGINEIFNPCANGCDTESCSSNLEGQTGIECFAAAVCLPKCQCIPNFRRDPNGICIPQDQCPVTGLQCGVNEEVNFCANACTTDACPVNFDYPIAIDCNPPLFCQQQCQCMQNFKRNQNGTCVPQDQCPGQQCGVNEVLNTCANGCDNDACPTIADYQFLPDCFAPAVCLTRCQCAKNFKRDENGVCVPQDQCPDLCGPNETFNSCPSVCSNDSCPVNITDDDPNSICTLNCGPPRCECVENFKRDATGNCIPIQDCPQICPTNEEYSDCPQNVCAIQNCAQIGQDISCAEPYRPCQAGCVCVPGTLRAQDGTCVPQEQCSDNCGPNEIFNNCPSVCKNDSCPVNLTDDDLNSVCTKNCGPPRCECVDNFNRNADGICIPIEDCPQICPTNEEYSDCQQNVCAIQNCDQIGQNISCSEPYPPCQAGCVCVPGTLRAPDGSCVPQEQCPSTYFVIEFLFGFLKE